MLSPSDHDLEAHLFEVNERLQALQRAELQLNAERLELQLRRQELVVRREVRALVNGRDAMRLKTAEVCTRMGMTASAWKKFVQRHPEAGGFRRGKGWWYWPGLESWAKAQGHL